jgi:HEAT repeat protein
MAFLADGEILFSGARDGQVLAWAPGGRRKDVDASTLCAELFGKEPSKVLCAVRDLAGHPDAVAALKEALKNPDEDPAALIRRLDDDEPPVRERAYQLLLGMDVEPSLRKALEDRPSEEVRVQLENLVKALGESLPPAPVDVRLRGVRVLERIATPEAKEILQSLARDSIWKHLKTQAQTARTRLGK